LKTGNENMPASSNEPNNCPRAVGSAKVDFQVISPKYTVSTLYIGGRGHKV
jgi:hypothetical protein